MYTQSELDALTDQLTREAYDKDSEGVTFKIFRNVHHTKFAQIAKKQLEEKAHG